MAEGAFGIGSDPEEQEWWTVGREKVMGNIQVLQTELKRLWTNELYSEAFNASSIKHKDFDHALKHVRKAVQALENLTEEADHSGSSEPIDESTLRKYLADIVISTARLANVAPTVRQVDLESAVFDRIRRKMGADLSVEPDLIGVLRKIKDARASGCSTGEAIAAAEAKNER